ncbi:3'-5' exonuclease [Providencia hangzhouensis]|uniref:3'-5' exonuclease n=1 Tax=Providencia hangzhouensis TaxID=3031799 RepID=UPI0034DD6376
MWTRFKRKGFGDSLVAFRNALALGQLSESSIDEGLTLSTVHTMKGLEKDIVFLIGMCEGVFLLQGQNGQRT